MKRAGKVKTFGFLTFLLFVGWFLSFENNHLTVTSITIPLPESARSFDGFRIVQLSDLHGKLFGKDQERLLAKVSGLHPDMVAFTGDLIDSNHYREVPGLKLLGALTPKCPVLLISGNHESRSGWFTGLAKRLQSRGVQVLRDERLILTRGTERLVLMGMDDLPEHQRRWYSRDSQIKSRLIKLGSGLRTGDFKILLVHRPDKFPIYNEADLNLVLTGHAHGGQIRLPWLGGLYAPGQGFLPRYTSGLYRLQGSKTMMIVNRGLGNSGFPQRIGNRPEIILIILKHL